ncbi:MAG: phage major capsid protein [Mycobacterium sp.]|uniref:phage major capsid protein n=1 Tax=Mycobacterium sp. TaxID=1785 RepID=UPI003F993CEF
MINKAVAQARLDEIGAEVKRHALNPTITKKMADHLTRLVDEGEEIQAQLATRQKAESMSSYASPSEWGYQGANPGDLDDGAPGYVGRWKSFGLPSGAPQVPPSSLHISTEQSKSLFDAAKAGTPYKVQLGQKDFAASLRTKAAGAPLTEAGLSAQLPAVQVPGAYGQYGKPYEPFRLLANIPTVAMTGPSAAYLQHVANTNEATRVPEGGAKPSLGPTVNELFIKPLKLAATVEASMEILADHEAFAAWLPVELQRSVVNSESLYLLQANATGGPTAPEFNGLLGVSGTLAQDATGLTFADALSHAYTKIRTGSAFSEPDLVITSPATAAAALRTKTTTGAYVFDIVRGPGALNQANEFDVFGVRTVTTTQCPDGTAIVLSIQGGACVGWIRHGLELMYNPYGGTTDAGADLWRTNQYSWRAEERISLSVPRPAAICVVTNLSLT